MDHTNYNNNNIITGNEENNPQGAAHIPNPHAGKAPANNTSSCQSVIGGAPVRALGDITNASRANVRMAPAVTASTAHPPTATSTTACHIASAVPRANNPNPGLRLRRTDGAIIKHSPTGSRLSNVSVAALKAAVGAASSSSPMATSATAPRRPVVADPNAGVSATAVAASSVKCKLDFAAPSIMEAYSNRDGVVPVEEGGSVMLPGGVLDIDYDDRNNCLHVPEYAKVIHTAFLCKEPSFMVDHLYMDSQEDVTIKMRAILVDWLVDVHAKFKLRPEVLFLTVNIIDRYLQSAPVLRRKLQLVGVCAMLIASKYEEIYPPEVNDFVFIADRAYPKKEVITMEAKILRQLGFELTIPHVLPFMYRITKAANKALRSVGTVHEHMTQYIVELSLLDTELLRFRPSLVAAAACYLAGSITRPGFSWDPTMEFYSGGYSVSHLEECTAILRKLLTDDIDLPNTNRLNAVKRKFSSPRFSAVATLVTRFLEAPVPSAAPAAAMDICRPRPF